MDNIPSLGLGLQKLLVDVEPRLCPLAKLIHTLPEEESILLKRVLGSSASTRQIHSELAASGIRMGRDTVANHRQGWCRCQGETK